MKINLDYGNKKLGIDIPDKGFVSVDSLKISEMDSKLLQIYRRKIGFVFQDYQLIQRKTVYENVAFVLEVCNTTTKQIEKRVPEVLKIVGLEKMANKFPQKLSGGEKQRVAIARALAHNPAILIADEPTGNLDPINTLEIIKLLTKINKLGTTLILASHDREVINYLRKRAIVIDNGRIVQDLKHGIFPKNKL